MGVVQGPWLLGGGLIGRTAEEEGGGKRPPPAFNIKHASLLTKYVVWSVVKVWTCCQSQQVRIT